MKRLLFSSTLFFAAFVATPASADLLLSNWTITENSLSFDISGSYTAPGAPSSNEGLLWLAQIGNVSWINDPDNPQTVSISGNIDGYDAESEFPVIFSFDGTTSDIGAYIDYGGIFPWEGGITFDFSDGVDDNVDIHLSMSFSTSKYNPEDIDPSNLQLYWGGDAFSGTATGAVPMALSTTAVPEPQVYAIGVIVFLGLVLAVRRRRAVGRESVA